MRACAGRAAVIEPASASAPRSVSKFFRVTQRGFGRGFQPAKLAQVFDARGLQCQHDFGKIEPLDLGQFLRRPFVVFRLRPQPHALARRRSSCASGSLIGARLADFFNQQRVDAAIRIVTRNAGETAVDHDADAVDRDGGLRNVRGDDDLRLIVACDRRILIPRRQLAVQRQKKVTLRFPCLTNGFDGPIDLVSARHEDQHIAFAGDVSKMHRQRVPKLEAHWSPDAEAGIRQSTGKVRPSEVRTAHGRRYFSRTPVSSVADITMMRRSGRLCSWMSSARASVMSP